MGRKDRNRPAKSSSTMPAVETTITASGPLVIRPLTGNRGLLLTSLILLVSWLVTLAWLAWQG